MKASLKFIASKISRRLRLPNGVSPKGGLEAYYVLEKYIKEPEAFWQGIGLRQVNKVKCAAQAFIDAGFENTEDLAKQLVTYVKNHRNSYYRPVFVMGPGGSGTTWLGAMLGDFSGFQYGREIYIPQGIFYLYHRLKNQEMSDLIWSIMILHSWGLNCPNEGFEYDFVNSARSIFVYEIFQDIWPSGRFIYLVRDPRDQILSVTFRKPNYRRFIEPNMDDMSYLIQNAKKYAKFYNRFQKINTNNIYVLKYEDLKRDTYGELIKIAKYFRLNINDNEIYKVVYKNCAENMRSGKVIKRGNLDEGGVAGSWRDLLKCKEKELIKPIIRKSLIELGYEINENW